MSENPLKWRLRRFISSRVQRRLLDPRRLKKARAASEKARRRARRPHEVHYFHQLDDPYSHLAAQALPALAARYEVAVLPHLADKPPASATPEADMFVAYNRRDAARIAPFYGLAFDHQEPPPPDLQLIAAQILAKNNMSYIAEISTALWAGDRQKLESMDKASPDDADKLIKEGTALRAKLKHYLSAMFYYEGEWYWGVDRLSHLEDRLSELDVRKPEAPADATVQLRLSAPESIARKSDQQEMKLEYFPSLRSPYTYLSFAPTLDIPKHYPVDLVLRPVMPMVMRGMKVPMEKGFYILADTKREGQKMGLPFGDMLDPVGPPVLRGYSLFAFAQEKGRGGEYLHSFAKGAFADRIDVYGMQGLRKVVERAGLNWEEARAHLDNDDWHERLEQNRLAMFEAGCWGVPSYILKGPAGEADFGVWGNDRIWLIKEEIARRVAL